MPNEYLLDTCVLCDADDDRLKAWLATVKDSQLYVSVASLMEHRKGIEMLRPRKPDVAAEIEKDMNEMVSDLGDRLLAIDATIADLWGRLLAPHPQKKRTNVCMDAAIAASALGKYWLATNNVDDFRGKGLNIINPFRIPPEEFPHGSPGN